MKTNKRATTLIELMITVAIVTMVILAVGVALVDTQRGWNKMYNRVYGPVATDSYAVKKGFDRIVRKSSQKRYILGTNNLTVFYYDSLNSTTLDRYANFRRAGTNLFADEGPVDGAGAIQQPDTTMLLARHVTAVGFAVDAAVAKMILELDDGGENVTVSCSAVRHNE